MDACGAGRARGEPGARDVLRTRRAGGGVPGGRRAHRRAGHGVEVHGHGHLRHTDAARERVERDLESALAVLDGLGIEPRLWRTPYGEVAAWTHDVAATHGLTVAGWTVDTHDWMGIAAGDMLAAVTPALRPRRHRARARRRGAAAPRSGGGETVRADRRRCSRRRARRGSSPCRSAPRRNPCAGLRLPLMELLQPEDWREALELKAAHPDALPLCGGTDVMVELNFGRARPQAMLDLDARRASSPAGQRDGGRCASAPASRYTRVVAELGASAARAWPRRRAPSARRRSATAARSAATSAPPRPPATRCRRCSRPAPRSSCASARRHAPRRRSPSSSPARSERARARRADRARSTSAPPPARRSTPRSAPATRW